MWRADTRTISRTPARQHSWWRVWVPHFLFYNSWRKRERRVMCTNGEKNDSQRNKASKRKREKEKPNLIHFLWLIFLKECQPETDESHPISFQTATKKGRLKRRQKITLIRDNQTFALANGPWHKPIFLWKHSPPSLLAGLPLCHNCRNSRGCMWAIHKNFHDLKS